MNGYIITLGYDERFAIRFLMRHEIKQEDCIIIITTRGYKEDEKAISALQSLISIVRDSVSNFEIYDIDYSNKRPLKEMMRLFDFLVKKCGKCQEIKACISGGMRAVIVMAFIALQRLSREYGKTVWIEIDFENLSGFIEFPLTPLVFPKDMRFINILKVLTLSGKKPTVRLVSQETGLSLATVYREMKKMKELGLLDEKFRPTPLGLAYLDFYESNFLKK